MIIESFKFHLRARNLSPRTIKATEDYLRPFLATCDPLEATQRNVEAHLADMATRCTPATVFTAWPHLFTFDQWPHTEGDSKNDPTKHIPKPIVPHTEVPIPSIDEIQKLMKCVALLGGSSCRESVSIAFSLLIDSVESRPRINASSNQWKSGRFCQPLTLDLH